LTFGVSEAAAMPGYYFEEFTVGQVFKHAIRRTVTETDNVLFSTMTHNPAPLHIDKEYMRKVSEFGEPLMNSFFTLGLIVGISIHDTTLGTTVANLGLEEASFPNPLFVGDTVHVETEVVAKRESRSRPTNGIVTFEHRGFNQRDVLVASCRRNVLMLRKPEKA
jgi:acyl dehydratase